MIVAQLVDGRGLESAVLAAIDRLRHEEDHAETVAALDGALLAWGAEPPTSKVVGARGGGWVAEEALAIAVYCALAAERDFTTGIRLAVNHSGDSDSTGAITGNLLGAMLGVDAIPSRWLERLELRDEIQRIADDLWTEYQDDDEWRTRYPPN
jgi:ADP-ribosylglycohydrolase